jgi:TonB-linked SusC/RagA family outer membrane protein
MQTSGQLEEVVVTALGIKRNPRGLGYSVTRVGTDEIIENSEPDLIRSLSGKVAGLNVNFSTGVAGAANQINLRGATTIGEATQPLIIVDGIAYDNTQVSTVPRNGLTTGGGSYESGLSSLDPNNIESMSVLKSVAAAALYGSRASNGAIIITTKTGSTRLTKGPKKMSVSVNSGIYLDDIANLPEYQNTYGNGVNYDYVNANGSWGPRFDSLETIPTWPNLLEAFPDKFGPTVPYEAQPNNVKNLFRIGEIKDNSVSLRYGNEDGSFSLTLSDLDQEGYIPFNSYDRTSIGVGANFMLDNNLRVGGSINYSDSKQIGGFFGNNQFAGSASSFARALWLGRTWDFSLPYEHPVTGASVTPNNGYDHPLWSWEHDQIITDTQRTVANVNFDFEITDEISTSLVVGNNRYNLFRNQIRDIGSRGDDGFGSATGTGSIIRDDFFNEDLEATLNINFNYDLGDNIKFEGILGSNTLQNKQHRSLYGGNTFISPGIFTLTNTINNYSIFEDSTTERTIGVYAEASFNYLDLVTINITGRNDWNSTLPKENRSYFYPSLSGSLIFTDLFRESEFLTFGKLRASYASVGNNADPESLGRTFSLTLNPTFNSVPTLSNTLDITSQDLTPEFTNEFEIGTDLEFYSGRIYLDFTYYKKTTTDLISEVSIPETSGYRRLITNIGEMENKGIEIGLTLIPVRTNNFRWNSYTTFSTNENKVTQLVEGLERIQFDPNQVAHAMVGEPFGVFFGSRFARDDDGNYLINRADGGIIEDPENGVIGDPNPDFRIGFTNTFSYKNFSLKTQFDWREGGDIQSISIYSLLGRGVTKDTEDRERSHIIPGYYGDPDTGLPILDNGNKIRNTTQIDTNELYFSPPNSNTFGINSVDESSVYDGTVYRLREVMLTYKFPKDVIDKTPFGKIELSFVGNNLWYFAPNVPKYTNFDPEVTSFGSDRIQGIEVTSAPTSKRYGIRLNLTF